jgi:hypothetical protein
MFYILRRRGLGLGSTKAIKELDTTTHNMPSHITIVRKLTNSKTMNQGIIMFYILRRRDRFHQSNKELHTMGK